MPLMKRLWLDLKSCCSTTEEFTWSPRKRGSRMERSSSMRTLPTDGFAKLSERSRYSGSCCRGCSKVFRTLAKRPGDSERITKRSTRSTDYQTSMVSDASPLSFTSCKSGIVGALFSNLLNWMNLSFFEPYCEMQFRMKVSWRAELFHC